MLPVFDGLDTRDADQVIRTLIEGARANRSAPCRQGSCDVIGPFDPDAADRPRLIATGDIHDNPVYLARVVQAAGLDDPASSGPRAHLTLHELIHSDRIEGGVDLSYRVLVRAAALKAAHPGHVHTILANHELAQLLRAEVLKDGVRCVQAFRDGLASVFSDAWTDVEAATDEFVRSMPIALRVRMPGSDSDPSDLLCAHSLPAPEMMERFDPTLLGRDLNQDDFIPRRGSAHIMVWGRHQSHDLIDSLAARWSVGLFVLGHEFAEHGVKLLSPAAVILNTDHSRGGFLDLDLSTPIDAHAAVGAFRPIA
ncbi:MAG: hypothetical protein KF768_01990 [Phycisphaeraceae bacterium]|nr:hypothetical protein [Phycisphaeraceae bacterium]